MSELVSPIRVCLITPEGKVSFPEVEDDPWEWKKLIGGYMEFFSLLPPLDELMGMVDEEGLLRRLPTEYNVFSRALSARGESLLGPIAIVRTEPPEFVSLTDGDVKLIEDYLGGFIVVRY